MRGRQLSFLPPVRVQHGGDIRKGKRKLARPIDTKRPMHVVLRSVRARGEWSLLHRRNKARVFALAHETAKTFGVRIYRFSNVGNHIHLLVVARSRRAFQAFLRVLSGGIAFAVTGTRKGSPIGRFWDKLAYSRIVTWGSEFRVLETYFIKNLLESMGIPREDYEFKPLPG
jgi:hypothetical protein